MTNNYNNFNQQPQQPMMGGYGYGMGMQPQWPQPMAAQMAPQNTNMPMNSTLTQDEINALRNRNTRDMEAFFQPPKDATEIARYKCNHRDHNGQSTLSANADGSCTCGICHETFNYIEPSNENRKELSNNVRHVVSQFNDIWNTMKANWGPISPELADKLYVFGTVIDQLPKMWDKSAEYILNYYGSMNVAQGGYGYANDYNTLNRLSAITTGAPMYGYGYPGMQQQQWAPQPAPQMNGAFWNGGYQQQPQPVAGMQMQQPQAGGWGAPQSYQAPVAPAQAAPQQPVANPAEGMANPIGQQAPVAAPQAQPATTTASAAAAIPGFEN
jgi:hypothetical protein